MGQKFGRLTVIEYDPEKRGVSKSARWICQCECGVIKSYNAQALKLGRSQSCGCIKNIEMIGEKFGRLLVIDQAETDTHGKRWRCICDCGAEHIVNGVLLRNGTTNSCGCYRRDLGVLMGSNSKKHGHARTGEETAEYRIWSAMVSRCTSPTNRNYANYGGRGIQICERWLKSFANFYADIGNRPPGTHANGRAIYSLDRINNEGDYEPSNCRWATPEEQNNNTRFNHYVEIEGVKKSLTEWLHIYPVPRDIFYKRIKQGMSEKDALITPFVYPIHPNFIAT